MIKLRMCRLLKYSFASMLFLWMSAWISSDTAVVPTVIAQGPEPEKKIITVQCKLGKEFVERRLNLNFGLRDNSDAQIIVEEVLKAARGLSGTVIARAAEVGNAEACRGRDGNEYILFNPGWLSKLYKI